MQITSTLEYNGATMCLKNTVRNDIRRESIKRMVDLGTEGTPEYDYRTIWLIVEAFTESVTGMDWEPCQNLTAEALEASYVRFTESVPPDLAWEWYAQISLLRRPVANGIERKDNQLTEEEANDPNSPKRASSSKPKS